MRVVAVEGLANMNFDLLTHYHRDLEKLFASHQYAVIEHEFGEATSRLERFRDAFFRHARDEDTLLLPAYKVSVGSQPGATIEMFESEHRKLGTLLARVILECGKLAGDPSPARILDVIERETQFKSLLEHHFLREENLLFPALDRALPEAERDRLLAMFELRAIVERLPVKAASKKLTERRTP